MDDLLSNFGDIDEDEEYGGESRYRPVSLT